MIINHFVFPLAHFEFLLYLCGLFRQDTSISQSDFYHNKLFQYTKKKMILNISIKA